MVSAVMVRFALPFPLAGSSLCRYLLAPTEESLVESVWERGCHLGAVREFESLVRNHGLTAGVLYAWRTASHSVEMSSRVSGRNGDRWEDGTSRARRRGAFDCLVGRRATTTAVDSSKI